MTTGGFPVEGMELTHILVVEDAARARDFYVDVLGAELYREYGGTSVVLRVFGTWHGSTVPPSAVLLLNGERIEELGSPHGDDVPPIFGKFYADLRGVLRVRYHPAASCGQDQSAAAYRL